MTAKSNSARFIFIFIFLGMLTAFGPFVTDMYLPSLPAMKSFFNTSISMVQLGLTFSMLGLAVGQLVFGPLSDKFGRRNPLMVSLGLFIISTFACIYAPNIETFILLRFIQGIAASGGIVIARSIAADKFKGKNLATALAIVGAINGIAPIAAPVLGGMMLKMVGWQGIFIILLLLGIILLVLGIRFQESLSHARRSKEKISQTLVLFKSVLQNKKFVFYTLELSFSLAILFAYIASSPFIIQNHYGFSPFGFSLFFAANAIAIGLGAGMAVKIKSQELSLKISICGMNLCCTALLLTMPFDTSIIIFEGLLFVLSFMLGISFTIATAVAMDAARSNAGTASAILGAAGFLFGSIVSPLVGIGNIMVSTGIVLIICSLMAAVFAYLGHKETFAYNFNR